MYRWFVGRMITALLLSGPVIIAQAGPSAKTPDQLIERLVGAENRGDADAFLAAMTDRSQNVLDERFGKVGPTVTLTQPDLKASLAD
jgi:hypothetical protein